MAQSYLELASSVLRAFQAASSTQCRKSESKPLLKRFYSILEDEIFKTRMALLAIEETSIASSKIQDVILIVMKLLKHFERLLDRSGSPSPPYPNLKALLDSENLNSPKRCGLLAFARDENRCRFFLSTLVKYKEHLEDLVPDEEGGAPVDPDWLSELQKDDVDSVWDVQSPKSLLSQATRLYNALCRQWRAQREGFGCRGPSAAGIRLACVKDSDYTYDMAFSACAPCSQDNDYGEADASVTVTVSKKQVTFCEPEKMQSKVYQAVDNNSTATHVTSLNSNHKKIGKIDRTNMENESVDICSLVSASCKSRKWIQLKVEQSQQGNESLGATISRRPLMLPQESISLAKWLETSHVASFGLDCVHKCLLAFVLASAALQLFKSPWMNQSWTKERIYFKEFRPFRCPAHLEIEKPYLRISQFSPAADPEIEVDSNESQQIVALGILLMEIHMPQFIKNRWADQLNAASSIANSWTLQATAIQILDDWEQQLSRNSLRQAGIFNFNSTYHSVIRACLVQKPGVHCDANISNPSDRLRDLLKSNVVKPLRSILMLLPDMSQQKLDSILFNILPPVQVTTGPGFNMNNEPEKISLFDYNTESSPEKCGSSIEWFKRLGKEVHPLLDHSHNYKQDRVSIAVLDTGIDLQSGKIVGHKRRIKGYGSWIGDKDDGFNYTKDEDGHGTHAAGLLLEVAHRADIYIARVAKGKDGTPNVEGIRKAIIAATEEWKVNIITMSFGFPLPIDRISSALREAKAKNILLFAAASNCGGNEVITYPAKHWDEVISIRATCGNGNFAGFNPNPKERDYNFGTLGEGVLSAWLEDEGDEAVKSGTSIATPIAAGLAAIILDFIKMKSYEDESLDEATRLTLCERAHGLTVMRQIFELMAGGKREKDCHYVTLWKLGHSWDKIKSILKGDN